MTNKRLASCKLKAHGNIANVTMQTADCDQLRGRQPTSQ
jgi:hypothetical protein